MTLGHRFDARKTAVAAFFLVPVALILAQSTSLPVVILSMVMFGMGHGILTVSFGYVTNMYFSAEVYGGQRAGFQGQENRHSFRPQPRRCAVSGRDGSVLYGDGLDICRRRFDLFHAAGGSAR